MKQCSTVRSVRSTGPPPDLCLIERVSRLPFSEVTLSEVTPPWSTEAETVLKGIYRLMPRLGTAHTHTHGPEVDMTGHREIHGRDDFSPGMLHCET